MKQKKSRFVLIWLLICLVLLAASFLVPGREKGETIQTAMRDAVLHDVNQIDFLGLRPVNPGFISAFVVMAVLLVAALCIRIFVIPRFKYVPGKFQLVLEQLVGMFDGWRRLTAPGVTASLARMSLPLRPISLSGRFSSFSAFRPLRRRGPPLPCRRLSRM